MKKPYKKPEIRKVKLAPEEAVLAKCKNQGHPGASCGCNSVQSLTS